MADKEVTGLDAVTVPSLTDVVTVRQSGDAEDKRETIAQVLSLSRGGVLEAVTTPVTTNTTAAETTVFSRTIPAGLLGANGGLRLTLFMDRLNNSGATRTFRVRVKLGGTTILDHTHVGDGNSASRRDVAYRLHVQNMGAADAQFARLEWNLLGSSTGGTWTVGSGYYNVDSYGYAQNDAVAVDTAASCDLVVTYEMSASHASLEWKLYSGWLEHLWTPAA